MKKRALLLKKNYLFLIGAFYSPLIALCLHLFLCYFLGSIFILAYPYVTTLLMLCQMQKHLMKTVNHRLAKRHVTLVNFSTYVLFPLICITAPLQRAHRSPKLWLIHILFGIVLWSTYTLFLKQSRGWKRLLSIHIMQSFLITCIVSYMTPFEILLLMGSYFLYFYTTVLRAKLFHRPFPPPETSILFVLLFVKLLPVPFAPWIWFSSLLFGFKTLIMVGKIHCHCKTHGYSRLT